MNKILRSALAALVFASPLAYTTPTVIGVIGAPAFAAEARSAEPAPAAPEGDGAVSRVMWIVLVVWLGIGACLFKIDRNIARLERKIDER